MRDPYGTNNPELLFEQYKVLADDLSRIREQRDRATRTYLTINSIILAVFGILLRGPQPNISGWLVLPIVAALVAVGTIACLQWWWRLQEFKTLVDARLVELEGIERDPGMEFRIRPVFNQAAQELAKRQPSKLSRLVQYTYERPVLPIVFMGAHVVFGIVVLLAFASGSSTNSSLESTVSTASISQISFRESPHSRQSAE